VFLFDKTLLSDHSRAVQLEYNLEGMQDFIIWLVTPSTKCVQSFAWVGVIVDAITNKLT